MVVTSILDYLRGSGGKKGFGSSSTAEDVTAQLSLSHVTAILTGTTFLIASQTCVSILYLGVGQKALAIFLDAKAYQPSSWFHGATSGIGAEAARVLAKRGARLVLPVRNLKAASTLTHSILKQTPHARLLVFYMDLASLASVRSFAQQFIALNIPLNILINNAGVVCRRFRLSEDGYELDFATNHLGHFLLTSLLLDKMVESAKLSGLEGRIINVSSCLHTWVGPNGIDFSALHCQESFAEWLNYAQSKLANVLHANELAARLKDIGALVTSNSLHPGIVRTNITRDRGKFITNIMFLLASLFTKSTAQGAATLCYVAVHPDVKGVTGKYFVDCQLSSSFSPLTRDTKLARHLWLYSQKLITLATS